MRLSDTAITRPVLATVINLLLVVLGIFAYQQLPVRQFPAIDPPKVTINTSYTGASASVVESEVTKPLEEALSSISGIEIMTATSFDEASSIELEFGVDRNIDLAAADVRDEIGRVVGRLPEEANDPVVIKESSSDRPMMWVTLTSETRDPLALTDYAVRTLIDPISVVNGVSRVIVGGSREYAMRVWLDRQAMTVRGVTVPDIMRRLESENLEIPAGRFESEMREMTIRVKRDMREPDQFERLVIRDGDAGRVLLGDVARVEVGAKTYRTALWIDGDIAVGLGVVRQAQANTLEVAQDVKAVLEQIRTELPEDINLSVSFDESIFIEQSRDAVVETLFIAFVLVVGVILLFLRSFRATLIPTLAIPVSLIAGAMVMLAFGFSINVLTLLAAVLAIGLVVDDTIVVLENIHRRIELGEPPLLAAVRGTREVGFAVIATTLVLVAVFVPIAFRTDQIGLLFNEFGITLAGCVVFSSLVALTWAPMLSSRLLKPAKANDLGMGDAGPLMLMIQRGYRSALNFLLTPWGVVTALSLTLAVGFIGVLLYRVVPSEPVPSEDRGFIFTIVDAPQGSTVEYTSEVVKEVEAKLAEHMGEDGPIERIISIVAPSLRPGASPNSGFVIIRLKDWALRDISQQELRDQLMGPLLFGTPGANVIPINPASFPGIGWRQAVQIAIGGDDYREVQEWGNRILAEARSNPGLVRPDMDIENTRPQYEITIDRDRAADLGISAADIGLVLQVMMGSRDVTDYEDRGRQYEVILQAQDAMRDQPADLDTLFVRSQTTGELVPLANVVTGREVGAPKELVRVNRRPTVTLSANLAPGYTLPQALEYLDEVMARSLPANATVTYLGQSRQAVATASGGEVTFLLALLVVFLVLAAQFESWIHPLIIIATVPLAITGALAGLQLAGIPMTIYAQIGVIMLVGLMAKNGILMVEFANQLRDRGEDLLPAIREAAVLRLRPILMTSVATVAGAVPLALTGGAGAEGRTAIGMVIIAGMTLATTLTLLVLPGFYLALARYTKPSGSLQRRLNKQFEEHPEPSTTRIEAGSSDS